MSENGNEVHLKDEREHDFKGCFPLVSVCVRVTEDLGCLKELHDEKDAEIYHPLRLFALHIHKNVCFVAHAVAHICVCVCVHLCIDEVLFSYIHSFPRTYKLAYIIDICAIPVLYGGLPSMVSILSGYLLLKMRLEKPFCQQNLSVVNI